MAELQRTAKDREQHLYLVFDDWHSGYSIRKLSLSRRSGKQQQQQQQQHSSSGEASAAEPLPTPFMRIRADRGYPQFFTSGFGPNIVAMHPGIADDLTGVPMVNVEELTIDHGPMPLSHAFPIFFTIGDNKLLALDGGISHCYIWMPEHSEEPWVRKDLSVLPFEIWDATSYGVQPNGDVLVSTKGGTTFILDTKEYVWKPYGSWVLPFTGHGHYDTSLEGFVGLSKDDPETLGYLYCSTMAASIRTGDTLHPCPDFKRSKEKVFNKNPAAERHVSATLLHMRRGRFCLVECVSIDNGSRADQESREPAGAAGGGGCFMYRVKTFSLVYDAKRDLKLKNCRVRCYSLPQEVTSDFLCRFLYHDPPAFWL